MLMVEASDGLGGVAMVSITINLNDIDEDVLAIDANERVSIYPNPVQKTLFVELDQASLREVQLEMFTVSGRQVLTEARMSYEGNKRILIDLESLKPGIYLLKIHEGGKSITRNILLR